MKKEIKNQKASSTENFVRGINQPCINNTPKIISIKNTPYSTDKKVDNVFITILYTNELNCQTKTVVNYY